MGKEPEKSIIVRIDRRTKREAKSAIKLLLATGLAVGILFWLNRLLCSQWECWK